MLSLSNSKLKNGILICIESIKLIYLNPILWAYVVPIAAYFIWCPFMPRPLFVEDISSYPQECYRTFALATLIVTIFFSCCLARHTMHLLRQQQASVHESFNWIIHHCKHIIRWMGVAAVVFFLSDLPGSFDIVDSEWVLVITTATIVSLCWIGFLPSLLLFFNLHIVTPIIATQVMPISQALKRSCTVIWTNFGTYIVAQCAAVFIATLFPAVFLLVLQRLMGATFQSGIAFVKAPQILLCTVINTLFYYEFYVKDEEVVVYHEQKDF